MAHQLGKVPEESRVVAEADVVDVPQARIADLLPLDVAADVPGDELFGMV
jgi:hypothetical protein